MRNMARIAASGQDKDAIQATKLLREFGQDLESDLNQIEKPESGGKSTAQMILESFGGSMKKVPKTLRRTIETQEIELGDPED
jgi:type IV secretory pathway TrbL component